MIKLSFATTGDIWVFCGGIDCAIELGCGLGELRKGVAPTFGFNACNMQVESFEMIFTFSCGVA